jgi:hypothetical protein
MIRFTMEQRPEWKPIGIYRITPLPILPIPPIPKKRVYAQMKPMAPRKLRRRIPINYGDLKTARRQLEF